MNEIMKILGNKVLKNVKQTLKSINKILKKILIKLLKY